MALFRIPNVRVAGIAACLPRKWVSNYDYKWIPVREREGLIKTTGVEKKRVSKKGTATSDLCIVAGERLINDLGWNREEISVLVFVSQSRDYLLPATACILQDRMKLSRDCLAFDVSMGCSAFNYGMSVISGLMTGGHNKKGILMMGDISSMGSYRDKSTFPLFGDAGTALAIEYKDGYPEMIFNLQTDGAGYKAIIIPDGGFRNPPSRKSIGYFSYGKGMIRTKIHVALDGVEVFNFSLREVGPNVTRTLEYAGLTQEQIDYFVFHQANLLMNETIRRKLKIPAEKAPYSLREFGNTSSASIPLTMVYSLQEQLRTKRTKMLATGFGVGLSWGSTIFETDGIVVPDILEIDV
jgi:3-oxoacyl-[acyl-carrier-protein] synthase III